MRSNNPTNSESGKKLEKKIRTKGSIEFESEEDRAKFIKFEAAIPKKKHKTVN